MAEFVFEPPVQLKGDVTVRTLGEAADFARKYVGSRLPRRRDGILKGLEACPCSKMNLVRDAGGR
jgi:hypothetical protein